LNQESIPSKFVADANDLIGIGRSGVVVGGKMDGIPIAIKVIPKDVFIPNEDCGLTTDPDCQIYDQKRFDIEVEQTKMLSKLGIVPELYYWDTVKLSDFEASDVKDALDQPESLFIMIMENFGHSLEYWLAKDENVFYKNEKSIKKQFFDLMRLIYDIDYFNMDAHFGNILYDPRRDKVKLLDVVLENVFIPEKMDQETLLSVLEDMWNNDKYHALAKISKKRKSEHL
jgi:hypothetical protein